MPAGAKPGDWIVTRTSGPWWDRFAAWAIQWDCDSPVNHAARYVGPTSTYAEGAFIEARPGGMGYTSIHAYPDAIWSTGRLPARLTPTDAQREVIVARAEDLIGTPYGWLDILAIGLAQRRTGHVVTGREWWVRRIADDGTLICSQAIDVEDRAAGINLVPGRLPGLVSPGDLYRLLLPVPAAA